MQLNQDWTEQVNKLESRFWDKVEQEIRDLDNRVTKLSLILAERKGQEQDIESIKKEITDISEHIHILKHDYDMLKNKVEGHEGIKERFENFNSRVFEGSLIVVIVALITYIATTFVD